MSEYTPAERTRLAIAWRDGGCQILGLQLSKIRPHFTVKDYAAAVAAAREELGDTTDYSAAVETLYQLTEGRATYGVVVRDGRVIDCAPYGRKRWIGKTEAEVKAATDYSQENDE